MKLDLHTHSCFSHDGRMDPRELIAVARRAGLSGVAVCDHNTLRGALAAQEASSEDFLIVPGAEYSTEYGHVLAYFISQGAEDSALPRLSDGRFLLRNLASFIKSQGGLLVAAHPLHGRDALPPELTREIHGLEVFNARQMARRPRTTAPTLRIAVGMGGIITAGSDAHSPAEVGGAYVELISCDALEEVKRALQNGKYSCHGRPARRRYEAIGRMGRSGVAELPRDLARMAVFTAQDVFAALTGARAWRHYPLINEGGPEVTYV